nr:MAG TPA: hypothetical protein [Caudoviricetes sp.]
MFLLIARLLQREPVSPYKELIETLEQHPEQWSQTNYMVQHKNSGMSLWIGNGFSYFTFYPNDLPIPITQKYRLWKAVRELPVRKITCQHVGCNAGVTDGNE